MSDENVTRKRAATRKLVYVVLICLLIVPLFWLAKPATQGNKDIKGQLGGFLASYREANHLSQSDLGEIDPTSETLRLGTLGMRGVAGALLWLEATEFQKKKDWTQLRSTLDQISKLQPHSIYVWRFQAWNISYNISVSFDDYHDKYYWVIEGIKFMLKGVNLNPQEPRLAWDVGWFVAHKIGRADEAKQYRRLFQKDIDFQQISLPPDSVPANLVLTDNWHVGKAWFLHSEKQINERHPVRGMAEAIFYSDAPMCQFYYADNLEKDGHFDEAALFAWRQASQEWTVYGDRPIPQTDSEPLRLNLREYYENELKKVTDELDKMEPGLREKIFKKKLADLTPEQRNAWTAVKRTPEQEKIAYDLASELTVSNEAVARGLKVSDDKKKAALERARYGKACEDMARLVDRERKMVNFDFWRLRATAEQSKAMMEARHQSYLGDGAMRKADLNGARDFYEKSLKSWRIALDTYPPLVEDVSLGGDLVDMIHRYRRCLTQRGEPFPKPFILQDILEHHDRELRK